MIDWIELEESCNNCTRCDLYKTRNPLEIEKIKKRMLGKISKKSKKSILKLYNYDLKGEQLKVKLRCSPFLSSNK